MMFSIGEIFKRRRPKIPRFLSCLFFSSLPRGHALKSIFSLVLSRDRSQWSCCPLRRRKGLGSRLQESLETWSCQTRLEWSVEPQSDFDGFGKHSLEMLCVTVVVKDVCSQS